MHACMSLSVPDSSQFSVAPLGVTDMLLVAVAVLEIDDGSVCLPSICLPICQTNSLLEQNKSSSWNIELPLVLGGNRC